MGLEAVLVRRNGFELGKNLFTTSEGGLDMRGVEATAKAVQAALE
jgi:hypothetical protein